MDSKETARRAEVISATNSPGWGYLKQIMLANVVAVERAAIDEEDEEKGSALRREAKASRAFLNHFLAAVENIRQGAEAVPEEDEADYFLEASYPNV